MSTPAADGGLLVVGHEEVKKLLPMRRCIEVMGEALARLHAGRAVQPLRTITWLPDKSGALGLMPVLGTSPAVLGVKVISFFPGNNRAGLPSHQGSVMLFEGNTGRPLAVVDADAVTAIRTAAVSGLATRLLARDDATSLTLMGDGAQAATHLEAILCVRPLSRVRVWGRDPVRAAAFARRQGKRHGIDVEPVAEASASVAGADIICTVTAASEPVLQGAWLTPGTHINAVGACLPSARELDGAAVAASRLYVDRRESTVNESGDYLLALDEGAISEDHIQGELGDLLAGQISGRRSATDITLFKSLGLAMEDLAAAEEVYAQALKTGIGARIPWSGPPA